MVRIETTDGTTAVDNADDDGSPLSISRIFNLHRRCLDLLEEDDIEGLGPILDEISRLMHEAASLSAVERKEVLQSHENLQKMIDMKTEYLRQQVEMAGSGRRAAGRYGAHRAPIDE